MTKLIFAALGSALLLNSCTLMQNKTALKFDDTNYTAGSVTVDGKTYKYRAYRVVYVANPVDTRYQSMNIYVPEAYFTGQASGKYSAQTAPIFLPNQVGGYMPGEPGDINRSGMGGPPPGVTGSTPAAAAPAATATEPPASSPNAMQVALSRGYVVASPGARGRTNQDASGKYYGKAPAAIVDLKAAVAYLHFNDARMPGNANRIISNGTSAGGALSALLGASGDSRDYEPYLKALGAAPASTSIYAVSAYCPITNLDNADPAYEWEFNGVNDYQSLKITQDTSYQIQRTLVNGTLSAEQIAVSNTLKPQFTPYLNSLGLTSNGQALTLDASGNGSFKAYMASWLQKSAQRALDAGTDLSKVTYLTIQNGKVTGVDFDAYAKATGRMKTPPAFDGLSLENGENTLFGTATTDARHFTAYGMQNSKVASSLAEAQTVKMMNAMNYISTPGTKTAQYWRIRAGTADRDTSHAISAVLATKLMNTGHDVDYWLPWNVPHSGDYDLPELFNWMDSVVAK